MPVAVSIHEVTKDGILSQEVRMKDARRRTRAAMYHNSKYVLHITDFLTNKFYTFHYVTISDNSVANFYLFDYTTTLVRWSLNTLLIGYQQSFSTEIYLIFVSRAFADSPLIPQVRWHL